MTSLTAYEDICYGDSVIIQIINTGNTSADVTFDGCSDISLSASSATIPACDSFDLTVTFNPTDFGKGDCNILVCGDISQVIQVTWNRIHCSLNIDSWELKPLAEITGEDNPFDITEANEDCSALNLGCISEPREGILNCSIFDDIQNKDAIYLSCWMFAKIVGWDFTDVPNAGWILRLCEAPTTGTYDMIFYGESCSEDITWASAIHPQVTFTDAKTFSISFKYNNPADMTFPVENGELQAHDFWLKDSLKDTTELTTDFNNSPYSIVKELSFAVVVQRVDGSVQPAFLTLPVQANFYGENNFGSQLLTNLSLELKTPSGDDTSYLSTVRSTEVTATFDITNLITPGTIPDGSVLMLIDVTAGNNTKRPADNYDLSEADLTNSTTGGRIITITDAITYSGSGDSFYANFTIDNTCKLDSLYRLILITYHVAEECVLCAISGEIGVIAMDDSLLDFSDNAATTFITVEKEFTASETSLEVPVNTLVDSRFYCDMSLLDSQVSAKTNGVITKAINALQSIELWVYTRTAMTGTLDLITKYTAAMVENICGIFTENQNSQVSFINDSTGDIIDLRLPMQVLNNSLKISGRDNLYQADTNGLTYSTLGAASLTCAANLGVNCTGQGFTKLKDIEIGSGDSLYRSVYISQLNEFWVCDGDSPNDCIQRINASTLEVLTSIDLPNGYDPRDILYMPDLDKVYVSSFASATIKVIKVSTKTITGTITGLTLRSFKLCRFVNASYDKVFATNADVSVNIIDVNTDTFTTAVSYSMLSNTPIFVPNINSGNGEIWVTDETGNQIVRIDPITNSHIADISTGVLPTYEPIFVPASSLIDDSVYVAAGTKIIIIDTASLVVSSVTLGTQIWHLVLDNGNRIIYYTDSSSDQLFALNADTLQEQGQFTAITGANDLGFDSNSGYLLVVGLGDNQASVFASQLCKSELPNFSWVGKDIILEWRLNFDYGN